MFGYAGKMLFVNLSTGKITTKPLTEDVARNYIGGPALGAKVLYDEMPANADVFGTDSMVGFVGGPFNNTKALFGGRYTVVSKSPVYGGWNDANSGGYFAPTLKKAGYDAVFVNGIAEKPVYIFIDNGQAQICDGSALWGLTVSQAEEWLRQRHGADINAALIGPGGENLSNYAAVINDGHRAAARGGTGAVMGSKKLKAVVVKGNQKTTVANSQAITAINKEITEYLHRGPLAFLSDGFGTYGTGFPYVSSTISGDAGIKNFSSAGILDYPEELAFPVGGVGLDPYKTQKYNCSHCPLGCGAFLNIPNEKWDLSHAPRPEYESMGAFGSNLLVGDAAAVVYANELCSEYGFDTLSAGGTIAWAAECYENNLLSRNDLDGIDLKWGDGDAVIALLEKICKGEGVGKVLLKGSRAAADYFGRGHEYLVVASGIEEPMHDGRFLYGMGRSYQFDPTPGRHVKGMIGPAYTAKPNHDYRGTGPLEVYGDMGVVNIEITNSSGWCYLGLLLANPNEALLRMLEAVTGFTYSSAEKTALGLRMFAMRQAFNVREGLRRKDFTVTRRMWDASNLPGPLAGVQVDLELLGENLYNAVGWNMDAVPYRETLLALGGMEQVVHDIYSETTAAVFHE